MFLLILFDEINLLLLIQISHLVVQCYSVCSKEHMIQNEVAILRRVKHPNIVLLIEEVDTYNELYLVMELVKVCSFHIY